MGEVFDRYTDTVGNYHFTDTETGHHVVSNESAIKELKWMLTDNSNTGDMYDALKMAIEALESLPNTFNTLECVKLDNNSTKVVNENDELSCSEEPNRSDLIRRQDAINKFEPWLKVEGYSEGEMNMLKAILYELTVMPSAQTEIIRCKDCWHYPSEYADCPMIGWARNENDFCSKAERKDNG